MTTGRINQVATSRVTPEESSIRSSKPARGFACVCGCSIASLHKFRNCLVPRLRSSVCTCSVRRGAAGRTGSAASALRDSISARNTAEPRYQMRLISVLNGWLKKATIDPYNSKTRAQVIQSRTSWHSVLKQKKKSEPGGSLIKHLLDVTWKRKPATREVAQSRGKNTNF